jgi:hypothetical protein
MINTNTFISNKPSSFHAHIGDTDQPDEETKQAQNPAETTRARTNVQRDELVYHEEDIVEDAAGSNWSQILDQGSAFEGELTEKTKTWKAFPYQLQQWAFETSNANIPLAERLEKSKWKYEGEGIEG